MQACAITTVRNAPFFLRKWVAHYGAAFGRANLFVLLDGPDQHLPEGLDGVNVIRLPHRPATRAQGDRRRARIMSAFARGLFHLFDAVIATDVDEYLIVDPRTGMGLAAYLAAQVRPPATLSALGLDLGQHPDLEAPLDSARPFLEQRRYAHVAARYTKPVVAFRPVTWGSGMHRVKGRNFRIDPELYLLHCGMIDRAEAAGRMREAGRAAAGWQGHLARRERLFDIIAAATPRDADSYFPAARRWQTWHRPLLALNKPGTIPGDPVVILPDRFRGLL